MGFLTGKTALITGIANQRSIAYGIAKALHREGAKLAFTYPTERFKERVTKIAAEFDSDIVIECDVAQDNQIEQAFEDLSKKWDTLDVLVHSIAFAPMGQLEGDYIDCITREGFKVAHDISSYSLSAIAKAALPMLEKAQGSILTVSYLGAVRTAPSYNVMGIAKASLEASVRYLASSLGPRGIRVNAISAGPIRTLAASGVKDLRKLLNANEHMAPLRKNVTIDEVGNAGAFLCSDLASGITGDILYVDAGYHIIGIPNFAAE